MVLCRMWKCSEVFELTLMYFFKPTTTASVTDAVQSKDLRIGQKINRHRGSRMNKTGTSTSDSVHTYLLPNCLMAVA